MTGNLYSLNYIITGGENHPKILYLHGFMGEIADWQEIVKQCEDRYRCLVLDLPGHGLTRVAHPRGYQFTECAKAITGLIRSLKFFPLVIVGYSMGGRLALYFASRSAQLLNAVMLESASPGVQGTQARKERRKIDLQWASQIQQEWPDFLYRWYEQPIFGEVKLHRKYFKLLQRRLKNDPKRLALALEGMGQGKQPSLWNRLSKIEAKIHLIVGEKDEKYMTISEQMAEKLPDCSRTVITDCSHNIHFENPDRFIDALDQVMVQQAN